MRGTRTYASNSEYGDAGDPHKERTVIIASDGVLVAVLVRKASQNRMSYLRPSTRSRKGHIIWEEIDDLDYKDG